MDFWLEHTLLDNPLLPSFCPELGTKLRPIVRHISEC